MIQVGLPIPQADSITLPLPQPFEQWRDLYLADIGTKLVAFVVMAIVVFAVSYLVRRVIREQIEDLNRRHILQKYSGYLAIFLLCLSAIALFADSLQGLGTIIALLLAGIAVALQDVLKSFVGWVYISGRSGIEVGSRVEIDGILGDVVDIGVLKITMLEVGTMVYGRQSSGRLVTIPNYKLLSDNVHIQGAANPWAWQEVRVTITFESDWVRAESIVRRIGDDLHAEVAPQLEESFRRPEQRYAIKYGTVTPFVYVSISGTGIELTLRYLTAVRKHRGSIDLISRRILSAFAADPSVELAHPTYRLVRRGPPATGVPSIVDLSGERYGAGPVEVAEYDEGGERADPGNG